MSAECSDCGRDIEYPAGSWPLGECSYCRLADRADLLEHALVEISAFSDFPGHAKASDQRKMIGIARAALSSEDATRPTGDRG